MLYERLKEESVTALKAGDSRLLGILRLLLSELAYAQADYKEGDLPDEEVVRILSKEAKKRKEAIEIYEKAGEAARADQEKYELGVIDQYLPRLMGESEVEAEVSKIASETGLSGGRLMGAVMSKLRGKVDGGMINKIVLEKYS